jgi:phage regulator Rha-like protein
MEFSPAVIQTATVESFKKAYPLSESAESTQRKRVFYWSRKMQIANIENAQTMTTREIADIAEASHDNVVKSIRALIAGGGVFKTIPIEQSYVHPQNKQTYTEYVLGYRDTMVVISGYSAPVRARIIDRWQELEAKQSKPPAVKTIKNPALALIAQLAQELDAMHSAQEQQAADLALVKSEVLTIGARTQPDFEFFTVLGYANRLGRKIDAKTAANFGRKCATLSKQCGIMVGTVPDARFGSVGTYHVSMLDSIFEAEAGKQ